MPFTKAEKYRRLLSMSMFGTSADNSTVPVLKTLTTINGTTCYPRFPYLANAELMNYNMHNARCCFAQIGSGATPFSEDDYKLDTMIGSGYFYAQFSSIPGTTLCAGKYLSHGEDEDGVYLKLLITGINNTENTITINEIGIAKNFVCNSSSSSSSEASEQILLYREVLENPLTVEVGKTYEIVVKIHE